eukprot:gene11792-24708_t
MVLQSQNRHAASAYRFALTSNYVLVMSPLTISIVNNMVMATDIHHSALEDISNALLDLAVDGLLEKRSFDLFVEELSNNLSLEDKRTCLSLFERIFSSFDRSASHVVDVVELACGLSVLCEGEKSRKLSFVFDFMDDDKDGVLTKRGLWKYFRSFLCVLLSLSGCGGNDGELSSADIIRIADESAVWTAGNLLASKSDISGEKVSGVRFEDLASWYTEGAFKDVMWLELLDLRKWLPLPPTDDSLASITRVEHTELPMKNAHNESKDDENAAIFFRCLLRDDDVDDVAELVLTVAAASLVRSLARESGLSAMEPVELAESLQKFASVSSETEEAPHTGGIGIGIEDLTDFWEMKITSEAFHRWVESLHVSGDMDMLICIYRAFAIENRQGETEDNVSLLLLCTGLSLLCKGSKSTKLSFGFHMLDWDDDAFLIQSELADFLGAYLRTLVALSQYSSAALSSSFPIDVHSFRKSCRGVSTTCDVLAEAICRHSYGQENGAIGCDFRSFGEWYNRGGFTSLPWIELIDLDKWGESPPSFSSSATPVSQTRSLESELTSRNGTETSCVLYLSGRGGVKRQFFVSGAAVRGVESLARRLFLSVMTPEDLWEVLFHAMQEESYSRACFDEDGDGLLSRKGFDSVIRSLAVRASGHTEHDSFLAMESSSADGGVPMVALHSIFSAFDRSDCDIVDVEELTCALTLLCSGTKSQKLAFSFDLMDDNNEGILSRRSLWRFFRSFLSAIMSLSGALVDVSAEAGIVFVDDAALDVSESLWQCRKSEEGVTFDDLAEWYTKVGYKQSPWLELVDYTKWRLFATSA